MPKGKLSVSGPETLQSVILVFSVLSREIEREKPMKWLFLVGQRTKIYV
jgi:hypothetical protein